MPVRAEGTKPGLVSVAALAISSHPTAPEALGCAGDVVLDMIPSTATRPLYAAGEATLFVTGELSGISVNPWIQPAGSYSESVTVEASYALTGFTFPATSLPTKLNSISCLYPVTATEWPLSSWTRTESAPVPSGIWNCRTDPSPSTSDRATSVVSSLAITRTPTKSGLELTAPIPAASVVRTVPSALGRRARRNWVASTERVFCWGAPLAHLKVPAVLAVLRVEWYPEGHSIELLQEKLMGSGAAQPARAASAAASDASSGKWNRCWLARIIW